MLLFSQGISVCYSSGKKTYCALHDTDITFESGKLYAIIGKSGSGKTTLLSCLSGLLEPSSGRVVCADPASFECDLYSMKDSDLSKFRNEHFGIIPQKYGAISSLTLYESILLPITIYRDASDDDKLVVDKLLNKLELYLLKDHMVSELSGGELRRASIARGLVTNPDIIFADEPTNDLDIESTKIVFQLLRNYANRGKIVIVVTHDSSVLNFSDVTYHCNNGSITK